MADISVKNNLHIENPSASKVSSPVDSPKASVSEKPGNSDNKSDVLTEEYGPVVSSSKDGDTLRVKNDNDEDTNIHEILQEELARLSEKNFEMPDYEVHTATKQIQKNTWDTSEEASDITSFAGYSDSELKQLYLKGDISQIDYNSEMEARAARRDEEATDLQSFNGSAAESITKLSNIKNDANTIDMIENGETSNTIPDEIRIQALQNFDVV